MNPREIHLNGIVFRSLVVGLPDAKWGEFKDGKFHSTYFVGRSDDDAELFLEDRINEYYVKFSKGIAERKEGDKEWKVLGEYEVMNVFDVTFVDGTRSEFVSLPFGGRGEWGEWRNGSLYASYSVSEDVDPDGAFILFDAQSDLFYRFLDGECSRCVGFDDSYTSCGQFVMTRHRHESSLSKIHVYDIPPMSLTRIVIRGIYYIPHGEKTIRHWDKLIVSFLESIKTFHEREFYPSSTIVWVLYSHMKGKHSCEDMRRREVLSSEVNERFPCSRGLHSSEKRDHSVKRKQVSSWIKRKQGHDVLVSTIVFMGGKCDNYGWIDLDNNYGWAVVSNDVWMEPGKPESSIIMYKDVFAGSIGIPPTSESDPTGVMSGAVLSGCFLTDFSVHVEDSLKNNMMTSI